MARGLAEAGKNVVIWYNGRKEAPENGEAIETEYGVKCANSGFLRTEGLVVKGSPELYQQVMSINPNDVYHRAGAAGRIWKRQQVKGSERFGKKLENYIYGSFIATSRMSARIANITMVQTAYNTSNAAVIHMCKATRPSPVVVVRRLNKLYRYISGNRVVQIYPSQLGVSWIH